MERPFDTLIKLSYKSLEKSKENFIFNFNQIDKILVWIVGFSITAISIIVSNIIDLNNSFSRCMVKTLLVLLMISIISGIIYRISALLFVTRYQKIMFFLEGAFSQEKMMPTEITELQKPDDIHEVYQMIKNDYDEDYEDVLELFNQASDNKSKQYYINYLREEYLRLADWSTSEYETTIEYIKGIYKKAFGISDKKINDVFKENKDSFYLKMYRVICAVSLFLCLITFITVIILLTINY